MSYGDFASHTAIDWQGHVGVVKYGDDSSTIALFYNRSVHNPVKSAQAGTPIHDDVDYVRIHQPGERLNIIDRPVTQADKGRFPRQWADYIGQREQIPDGTPIDLLFPAHPNVGANLRGLGVHTIEQCAKLSGHAMDVIGMGAQEYQNRANEYLEAANQGVGLHKLHRELEERDSKIRVLESMVGSLKGQLDQLLSAVNSGPANPLLSGGGGGGNVAAPPSATPKAFMVPPGYKAGRGRSPKTDRTEADGNGVKSAG
jgi:hypothetical protein